MNVQNRKKASNSTSGTIETRDTADEGQVSPLESEDDCDDCVFFVELCILFSTHVVYTLSPSGRLYSPLWQRLRHGHAAETAVTVESGWRSLHQRPRLSLQKPGRALCSIVQLPQPQKQDRDVQYTAVKFNPPSATIRWAYSALRSFICCGLL